MSLGWSYFKLRIGYFFGISIIECFINSVFPRTIGYFRSTEFDCLPMRGILGQQYPTNILNSWIGRYCFPLSFAAIIKSKAVVISTCVLLPGVIGDKYSHFRSWRRIAGIFSFHGKRIGIHVFPDWNITGYRMQCLSHWLWGLGDLFCFIQPESYRNCIFHLYSFPFQCSGFPLGKRFYDT